MQDGEFSFGEWIKEYQRLWNNDATLIRELRRIDATMKYYVEGAERDAVFVRLERGAVAVREDPANPQDHRHGGPTDRTYSRRIQNLRVCIGRSPTVG